MIEVKSDKIKLLKNAPPIPDVVKIDICKNDSLYEIKTLPLSVKFIYNFDTENDERLKKVLGWIRQYSYSIERCPMKNDLVFDGDFYVVGINEGSPCSCLHLYDMLLKTIVDFESDKKMSGVTLKMSYDYFFWDL